MKLKFVNFKDPKVIALMKKVKQENVAWDRASIIDEKRLQKRVFCGPLSPNKEKE